MKGGNARAIAAATKPILGTDGLERERISSDLRLYHVKDDPGARAFVDIALWDLAGKVAGLSIGKMIGGVPVLSAADLPPARETAPVQLSAVGQSGRREKVARLFEKAGYVRGRNYFCVA